MQLTTHSTGSKERLHSAEQQQVWQTTPQRHITRMGKHASSCAVLHTACAAWHQPVRAERTLARGRVELLGSHITQGVVPIQHRQRALHLLPLPAQRTVWGHPLLSDVPAGPASRTGCRLAWV